MLGGCIMLRSLVTALATISEAVGQAIETEERRLAQSEHRRMNTPWFAAMACRQSGEIKADNQPPRAGVANASVQLKRSDEPIAVPAQA